VGSVSRALTVTTGPGTVSTAEAIEAAARLAPLLIITHRAFNDLAAELGSDDAAMRHLLRVSERAGKPVGVNFAIDGGSRTCFLAPRS
jgi:hypothetical protein